MPKIPEKALDLVCYLYRSEEEAEEGRDFGGTAFLVSIASTIPERAFIYAVSNWHVAVRGGYSMVRLNTRDGRTETWPLGPEDWHFDPALDIAIASLPGLDTTKHAYSVVPFDGLVTQESVAKNGIGPGDDVFMVGRFMDHDGGRINRPAVRFGNISVDPSPIKQPNGKFADAYCVDMHSRSGYSGSPVFVYRTPGYDLNDRPASDLAEAKILFAGNNFLAILGIHFAQFPEQWEIDRGIQASQRSEAAVPLITDGLYVRGLSGMTCVLPAWNIAGLLNSPKLAKLRDEAERLELMRPVDAPKAESMS